jgi:hypothetical protein
MGEPTTTVLLAVLFKFPLDPLLNHICCSKMAPLLSHYFSIYGNTFLRSAVIESFSPV